MPKSRLHDAEIDGATLDKSWSCDCGSKSWPPWVLVCPNCGAVAREADRIVLGLPRFGLGITGTGSGSASAWKMPNGHAAIWCEARVGDAHARFLVYLNGCDIPASPTWLRRAWTPIAQLAALDTAMLGKLSPRTAAMVEHATAATARLIVRTTRFGTYH